MDHYITKFRNNGILIKPSNLRKLITKEEDLEIDYNIEKYHKQLNAAIDELIGIRGEATGTN